MTRLIQRPGGPKHKSKTISTTKPAVGGAASSNTKALYFKRRLAAIAVRWDARAATWDRSLLQPGCHLNDDQAYARFLREAQRIIAERNTFCAARGVIDAGCGTGLVLAAVIQHFAWGLGVDVSKEMIRAARRKRIPKTQFLIGDCFGLSGMCPPAGAVLSRGILLSHYGPHQGLLLLKSLARSLSPDGFLLLDFLNKFARDRYPHLPETKSYFYGHQVCKMAKNAGFRTAKIVGRLERRVLILMAEM